ncbi:MAG: FecR domain-containing protein [Elusimicrobiota bacterium]
MNGAAWVRGTGEEEMITRGGRRRCVGALFSIFLAASGATAARAAAVTAGVVVSVSGKPKVTRAGATAAVALKLNDVLNEGDTVKTGPKTLVGIAFVGGAELRINENSTFKMLSGGGDKPTSVWTALGNAWTRHLKGNARIEVRTPTAVCAVRGTEADVDISGGGALAVKVYEGAVDVSNDKGTTALAAGQLTTVAGSAAAPRAARAMTPQDYATWQNSLKAPDLNKSLKLLHAAAVKNRTLNLSVKGKDGKKKEIKLNFEKKEP